MEKKLQIEVRKLDEFHIIFRTVKLNKALRGKGRLYQKAINGIKYSLRSDLYPQGGTGYTIYVNGSNLDKDKEWRMFHGHRVNEMIEFIQEANQWGAEGLL